jgi:hypothetical protein
MGLLYVLFVHGRLKIRATYLQQYSAGVASMRTTEEDDGMARLKIEALVADLAAQLAAQNAHVAAQNDRMAKLQAAHDCLAHEHARQLAMIQRGQQADTPPSPPTGVTLEPRGHAGLPSRRQVLRRLGAGAAATLGAGALLDSAAQPAAAATGKSLHLGKANLAETITQLSYDGAAPIAGKIIFHVNDTTLASTSATYPAALAGWAGGGKAGVTTGVFGKSNGAAGNGVVGLDDGSGIDGAGVRAMSDNGTAIVATSASTQDSAQAVVGVLSYTGSVQNTVAVRGQNNNDGIGGSGVWGSYPGNGSGVLGTADQGAGIRGTSSAGFGVWGTSTYRIGVYGTTTTGNGVQGTSDTGTGVYGLSNGDGYGVYGSSQSGCGVFAASTLGTALMVQGDAHIGGNFHATGTKSAVVPAENGSHRTLYCVESPECWFEDFGSATLIGGSARVTIESLFAATVQTNQYHVFLTPLGQCAGLCVSAMDAAGFTVQELHAGQSTVAFSYRLVARRKDVTAPRLAQVTLPAVPAMPATADGAAPGSVPAASGNS